MNEIECILKDCYDKVMKDSGVSIEFSLENSLNAEFGLDSLGLVSFIFELEEALSLNLDSLIGKIRDCKNLREVMELISINYNKV